jgi:CheY-like chemotaxis protein
MSTIRVLLADDDDAERDRHCYALRPLPCTVVQARSGTQLQHLLGQANQFDVIITDICMPGPSGLEVIAEARRDGLTTPVIFVTSSTDRIIRLTAERLGHAVLLIKPVKSEDLLDHVRQSLAFGSRGLG